MATSRHEEFLDAVPRDWTTVRLGSLGQVVGGGTPSRAVPAYWGGDIPWLTPGELSDAGVKHVSATAERITVAGLAASGAVLVPPNTLLVTTRATLGRSALAGRPMATNQGFKNLVFDEGSSPDFYFHLAGSLKIEIVRRASGTTFLETSGSQFADIRVPVPPPREQRRIAEILDTLDTTITSAERLLAKCESLSRGLLARSFGSTEWSNIQSLRPLGDVLAERPRNGHSPVEAADWQGAYLLGLGCLTTEGFVPRQLKNAPVDDLRLCRALLSNDDILVSRSNTPDAVGLVGRFRTLDSPAYYPDLMMRLRPTAKVRPDYLELVLRSQPARRYIQSRAAGTSGSMVKIGSATLAEMPIPVPILEEQGTLVALVQGAAERTERERADASKLRSLRAGLADDLLTGRVRTVQA